MGLTSVTNPRLRLAVYARGRTDDRTRRRVVVAACDRPGDDQVMSWAKISSVRGATISVRVQPRTRSDALVGLRDGVLVVRVVAPPLDRRANDPLCRLLADLLGVRRSRATIIRGGRGARQGGGDRRDRPASCGCCGPLSGRALIDLMTRSAVKCADRGRPGPGHRAGARGGS